MDVSNLIAFCNCCKIDTDEPTGYYQGSASIIFKVNTFRKLEQWNDERLSPERQIKNSSKPPYCMYSAQDMLNLLEYLISSPCIDLDSYSYLLLALTFIP